MNKGVQQKDQFGLRCGEVVLRGQRKAFTNNCTCSRRRDRDELWADSGSSLVTLTLAAGTMPACPIGSDIWIYCLGT